MAFGVAYCRSNLSLVGECYSDGFLASLRTLAARGLSFSSPAAAGTASGATASPLMAWPLRETGSESLTPREWEWLMGLPDGSTLVPYRKNEPAKDSPRFTGLGNSVVVPILSWIGQRITSAFTPDNAG